MIIGLFALTLLAEPQDTYREVLRDFERYAESIWREHPAGGYFGDGGSAGNGGIRGTCGVMVAYATLVRADAGGDTARRLARLERGLRYAADTHLTGPARCVDGKQWGHGWQTSLWCGSLAFATLLVEDRLTPETVAAVRRVVADEADYHSGNQPASGFQGDSKAEENGWNSNTPAVAAAWLRDDPRADAWREGARRYLVNTYTVADRAGDPLADWITTQTLYPSFACENHGFFHPEYQMVAGMSCGDSWVMTQSADPATAEYLRPAAEHLHLPVWQCLHIALLDSGEFAFPSGMDWALHSYGQISYLAWLACHFGDPTARWAEARVARRLRERQRTNGDGRITGESVANGFYREAVGARRVAFAWWQHELARHPTGPATPPADGTFHLPDVKLIVRRDAGGYVSLSYGAKVMGLVHPPARDDAPYLTTPRDPGLFAQARSAEPVRVEATDHGFVAELLMSGGAFEERRVAMAVADGVTAVIEAPRRVLLAEAPATCFPLGIENHALTGGLRRLAWAGGQADLVERSGGAARVLGAWATVDDRLGVTAGPRGEWSYRVADRYNRGGAAEDYLDFLPADAVAARYAVVVAGDGAALRAVADSLSWRDDGDGRRLAVTTPAGRSLSLALPAETGTAARLAPIAGVTASTESAEHPAARMIDGRPETFWVSDRGARPGDGPTPERPEMVTLRLAAPTRLAALLILPRPAYGPRRLVVAADGVEVWRGEMTAEPLRVPLGDRPAGELTLTLLSSFDPREPANPRNVQIAELLPLVP